MRELETELMRRKNDQFMQCQLRRLKITVDALNGKPKQLTIRRAPKIPAVQRSRKNLQRSVIEAPSMPRGGITAKMSHSVFDNEKIEVGCVSSGIMSKQPSH